MPNVQAQPTLVEQVVNAIVSEIVDGELPSNSPPGRGLIVSPIDPDFVRKLYEVRAMLDGLAARLAAERGAERAKIEGPAYLDAGRAAVASGSLNEQIEADMNFHASSTSFRKTR